jgi:hypothetical protein
MTIMSHITARLDRAQADAIEELAASEGLNQSEALRRYLDLGIAVVLTLTLDEQLQLEAALATLRAKESPVEERDLS